MDLNLKPEHKAFADEIRAFVHKNLSPATKAKTFSGKHYDRVEDHEKHYLIKPTIDRAFKAGEFSTISDHKDNVHWFKATSETAYLFNVHVIGYDPKMGGSSGRLYLDPEGEKLKSGLIVAKKMTSSECHKKYG